MSNITQFRAEVRKAMTLRDWSNTDLARATGYSLHYINSLIGKGRYSARACKAIAAVLGIPEYLVN